jgi:hypothetical protein
MKFSDSINEQVDLPAMIFFDQISQRFSFSEGSTRYVQFFLQTFYFSFKNPSK